MGDNYYKRVILDSGGTGIVEDDGLYKTTYKIINMGGYVTGSYESIFNEIPKYYILMGTETVDSKTGKLIMKQDASIDENGNYMGLKSVVGNVSRFTELSLGTLFSGFVMSDYIVVVDEYGYEKTYFSDISEKDGYPSANAYFRSKTKFTDVDDREYKGVIPTNNDIVNFFRKASEYNNILYDTKESTNK